MNSVDQFQPTESRRQTESPTFWVLLAAGSVLLHLVLLLAFNLFFARTAKVQVAMDPISIELVEPSSTDVNVGTATNSTIAPGTPSSGTPSSRSSAATAPNPTTGQAATPTAPAPTAVTPSQPSLVQPGAIQPVPNPSIPAPVQPPIPQPIQTPAAANPEPQARPPAPIPPLSNNDPPVNPSPDTASSPLPSNPGQPFPTQPPPEDSPTNPAESGVPLPSVPGIGSEIDNGSGPNNKAPEPGGQAPVANNPVPAEFSASIAGVTPANVQDIPDGRAKLRGVTPKRSFTSDASGCVLTPEAATAFGSEVILRVVVNAQGRIDTSELPPTVGSSSNTSYENLARCTLQTLKTNLEFAPAYDLLDGQPAYRPDNVDVRVVISAN